MHFFKLLPSVFAINTLILLLCRHVLFYLYLFCFTALSSVTWLLRQSSPDLLRLLTSRHYVICAPWIWHDSIIQFGHSSFSSRFPLTQRPLVKHYLLIHEIALLICAHRVMYLSLPESDTLACGASPVTCGGLLHMSTGTDILPTGWESQPCLVMSRSSLVNLIWLGFWEQSDGLTLGWILHYAPLQEVLIYLLSWLCGPNSIIRLLKETRVAKNVSPC